ncbi:alanine racemase [Conexibacter sp. DBS9H8]|uniref:alanine racemase n=1 Tax=Conexibacter sp. DBS9H8 TaxID=2937801 RepID=UPI00200D5D5C|nr:alanine racemase [Conexibacter sp. DBS9H8]
MIETGSTSYDPAALRRLREEVRPGWKGAPLERVMSVAQLATSGIEALDGTLPLPLLLLSASALVHNVDRMARFAADRGVLLAPHAKTTMSPELIAAQIDAGAWAMTAATPSQIRTLRAFGVRRIVCANELVETAAIAWLAAELDRDPSFELICLVDSVAGVALLDRELRQARSCRDLGAVGLTATRRLPVLLEVGTAGGRAGARTLETARAVADAVGASEHLELIGVEFFEGLRIDAADMAATIADVDAQLEEVHAITVALTTEGRLTDPLVSAGGSALFDRVLARFGTDRFRVLLRSGCYISQDGGFYAEVSPLAGRGEEPEPLENAIEVWGAVLSRPEAEVAVVGAGRRDMPYDIRLPTPRWWRSRDGRHQVVLSSASVLRLNDQHATVRLEPDAPVAVGDLVGFTVSHPCGAFDRWAVIPVVDDARRIVAAVHTRF